MRDHVSGRIGVGRSVAVIQRAGEGPALSNVALIRRVDPAPRPAGGEPEQQPRDPFLCSVGKVTPTLADMVDPQAAGSISHYFVIYPAATSDEKPQLFLQYLRDDQVVAQTSPELPEREADGSIPYIATAPASSFPPGRYLVNVVVRQGGRAAVERAFFQVGR